MLDLATLDVREACDKPYELELLHPATKKGIGSFVSILGCESTKIRQHERKIADEKLAELRAGKSKRTPEEGVQRIVDVALASCVSWRDMKFKGKKIEFNEANAKIIFEEPGLDWIAVQVYQEVQNLELFMKG